MNKPCPTTALAGAAAGSKQNVPLCACAIFYRLGQRSPYRKCSEHTRAGEHSLSPSPLSPFPVICVVLFQGPESRPAMSFSLRLKVLAGSVAVCGSLYVGVRSLRERRPVSTHSQSRTAALPGSRSVIHRQCSVCVWLRMDDVVYAATSLQHHCCSSLEPL